MCWAMRMSDVQIYQWSESTWQHIVSPANAATQCSFPRVSGSCIRLTVAAIVVIVKCRWISTVPFPPHKLLLMKYRSFLSSCFRLCLSMQCVDQCECYSFKELNVRNLQGNLLIRQPMHLRNLFFQAASGGSIKLTVEAIVVLVKSQMHISH